MHGFFCVCSFVVVYFGYPETMGVPLEEMGTFSFLPNLIISPYQLTLKYRFPDRLFGDTPLQDPESTSLISPTSRSIPSKTSSRHRAQSENSAGILGSIKALFGRGVKLNVGEEAAGGLRGREREGGYEIVERSEGEN